MLIEDNYIVQTDLPNCGAFALAYYTLERQVFQAEGVNSEEAVMAIYDAVRFEDETPTEELRAYSDPVKMMDYLESSMGISDAVFYTGGTPVVSGLIAAMEGGPEGAKIAEWRESGKLQAGSPPQTGGCLLSLCYKRNSNSTKTADQLQNPKRVHYTLLLLDEEPKLMLNSWDGFTKPITQEFLDTNEALPSGGGGDYLQYLGAGIFIPTQPET